MSGLNGTWPLSGHLLSSKNLLKPGDHAPPLAGLPPGPQPMVTFPHLC